MYNTMLNKMKREFDKYSNGVILYLKEKYNQEFEILGAMGETLGTSGDRWGVRVKNGDSKECFTVFGSSDKGGYQYSDSYYSVLVQEDYKNFVSKIIKREFENFKIFIDISRDSPNPPALNKNVAVEDIWRYAEGEAYTFISKITILLPYSESQKSSVSDKLSTIGKKMAECKLPAWVEAYTLEQDSYKSVKQDINSYLDFEKYLFGKPDVICVDNNYNVAQKNLEKNANTSLREDMPDEKLVMLCSTVYLNGLLNNKYMGVLGEILEYIKFTGYTDSMINGQYPCEMTKEQWDEIVDEIVRDSQLYPLKIIKSIDVNEQNRLSYPNILPGHRAVCFLDIFDNAYVVFRGTCGDEEWYDNAAGMVLESTKQQQAAASFVNEIREDKNFKIKQLVVTGHSKGGNKAQFAAIATSDGYVNRCVAIDGQGFSKSFIKKYESNIKKRADSITLLAEQRDFVNCLGFYINETTFHRGWRGNAVENMPYGYPLPYFHCPDALVNEHGGLSASFSDGSIPKTLNQLVAFILEGSKYAKNPYDIVVDVIALLMKNKKSTNEQIAEALKDLIIVFMELISCSDDFKSDITELVYEETDVIISTVDFVVKDKADNNTSPQKTLSSLVVSKLVKELFSSFTNIKHLVESLGFIIMLIKEVLKNIGKNRLQFIDYVLDFVRNLLTGLSAEKVSKPVLDFLFNWSKLQICFSKQFGSDLIKTPASDMVNVDEDDNVDNLIISLEKTLLAWQEDCEE